MNDLKDLFFPDDFDRIYQKYFVKLKERNELKFDPSGWLNTYSEASDNILLQKIGQNSNIVPYYSDYNDQLYCDKEPIRNLISIWDKYHYSMSEFTLCSSVTLGSLVVLSVLAKKGVKNIYFETPAFYASINQAKNLGLKYFLLPTYFEEEFSIKFELQKIDKKEPFILWLTQPRMSLGINQVADKIKRIYHQLPDKCYIVIDEASEQLFPSHLSELNIGQYPRVIKIRNFYKGMGINGLRLSFIAHDKSLREEIQRDLENYQGAIDYFSLLNTVNLANDIQRFELMLSIANQQTKSMRLNLKEHFEDDFISFSQLVNGYIGTICLNFSKLPSVYRRNRENLLKHCFNSKTSIILGSTMKFAYDAEREFIRINYFKSKYELEGGIKVIQSFPLR